jgi:ATP-dependent Lon protease
VIIPAKNRRDLDDVPKDILDAVKVTLVETMDEILPLALAPMPAS